MVGEPADPRKSRPEIQLQNTGGRIQEAVGDSEYSDLALSKRNNCIPTASCLLPSEFSPLGGRCVGLCRSAGGKPADVAASLTRGPCPARVRGRGPLAGRGGVTIMFTQASQPGPLGRIFEAVTVFQRAGALKPSYVLSLARASKRWGPTAAAGFAASAARRPQATALVDDLGKLSFEEVHRWSTGAPARSGWTVAT
jgi:hypothetical protein